MKRMKNKNELLDNTDLLNKFLSQNPESKKQFDLNTKMIDFNYIPNEYKDLIISKFKNIYNL